MRIIWVYTYYILAVVVKFKNYIQTSVFRNTIRHDDHRQTENKNIKVLI